MQNPPRRRYLAEGVSAEREKGKDQRREGIRREKKPEEFTRSLILSTLRLFSFFLLLAYTTYALVSLRVFTAISAPADASVPQPRRNFSRTDRATRTMFFSSHHRAFTFGTYGLDCAQVTREYDPMHRCVTFLERCRAYTRRTDSLSVWENARRIYRKTDARRSIGNIFVSMGMFLHTMESLF